MKKVTKGLFSLVLAFILCFSSCPLSALDGFETWTVKAEATAEEQTDIVAEHKVITENTVTLKTPTVYYSSAQSTAEYSGCYGNQLQGNAKGIYDALALEYGEKYGFDECEIELEEPVTFELEMKGNKFVQNEDYLEASQTVAVDFQNAVDAFFYDYANVFWIKSGQYLYYIEAEGSQEEGYTGIIDSVIYMPMTYHTDEFDEYDAAVSNAVTKIKGSVADINDRYEVVKAIHDYICNNAYYKLSVVDYTVHSVYPFFVGDGGMVCDGYAKTFKVLCDAFGIESACIGGYAYNSDGGEGHMWNYVKMEDEKWYLVDTTWDDGAKETDYTYFLASGNAYGLYAPLSEERFEINTFSEAGYMAFAYPVLSTSAFKRHYHSWESDYTVDTEPTCTEKGSKSIHCTTCASVKNKEEIASKGHSYVLTSKTEATYTEKATKTYTCSVCDKIKLKTLGFKELDKVTSLKVSNVTDDSVKLTWSKVTGAEKYEVSYKYSGENWRSVTTTKRSITLSNLKSGKKYAFRVRAAAGKNLAEYSSIVKCTTFPAKVSKITAVQSASAIKLSWKAVEGATGYRVYKYNPESKKWEKVATTTAVSCKVKNLDSGTVYKFRVKAYIKADGQTLWGEASSTFSGVTKPAKAKISSLTAKKASFVAKWKETEGASGYLLEYSLKKDFSSRTKILVKGGDTLKNTVKGLESGKTYYVRVRAYKSVGTTRIYGAVSTVKKVTVK